VRLNLAYDFTIEVMANEQVDGGAQSVGQVYTYMVVLYISELAHVKNLPVGNDIMS